MGSTTKVLTGFIAGVTVGALAGVLYAPQKGSTTRKRIVRKSNDLVDDVKGRVSDSVDSVKDRYESTRKEATQWFNKVKK
jgi:gas vesicle protein